MKPVAFFHSPFTSKFGIPRQSGVVAELSGQIVLEKEYAVPEAVRGIDGFDYLWLIWEFSANRHSAHGVTVRPPRLGGNESLGVFATRSPFRPNPIGLSCVRLDSVEFPKSGGVIIHVKGADLMDGTPILDIKPYVPYADAHPEARGGFTDNVTWHPLDVVLTNEAKARFTDEEQRILKDVLAQDPRPKYHDDPNRIYGMPFGKYDVKFRVENNVVIIL